MKAGSTSARFLRDVSHACELVMNWAPRLDFNPNHAMDGVDPGGRLGGDSPCPGSSCVTPADAPKVSGEQSDGGGCRGK